MQAAGSYVTCYIAVVMIENHLHFCHWPPFKCFMYTLTKLNYRRITSKVVNLTGLNSAVDVSFFY